ncbi:MAG: hypothetical protein GY861_23020 [bacterium]|nr:hypothetical protein [bacterium]
MSTDALYCHPMERYSRERAAAFLGESVNKVKMRMRTGTLSYDENNEILGNDIYQRLMNIGNYERIGKLGYYESDLQLLEEQILEGALEIEGLEHVTELLSGMKISVAEKMKRLNVVLELKRAGKPVDAVTLYQKGKSTQFRRAAFSKIDAHNILLDDSLQGIVSSEKVKHKERKFSLI